MNSAPYNMNGAALDAKAAGFDFEKGFDFVSGIHAPMYIDTRKLFHEPALREKVIAAMQEKVVASAIACDVIAGVESGAIAPAALLASVLGKRFVYVKKKPKDHGLKKMIECGDVAGQKVLLVEDLITTGGSSLNGIAALRNAGGTVTDCLVIHTYGFPESVEAFEKAGITVHTLVSVADIAQEAAARGIISTEQSSKLISWLKDPRAAW